MLSVGHYPAKEHPRYQGREVGQAVFRVLEDSFPKSPAMQLRVLIAPGPALIEGPQLQRQLRGYGYQTGIGQEQVLDGPAGCLGHQKTGLVTPTLLLGLLETLIQIWTYLESHWWSEVPAEALKERSSVGGHSLCQ